MRIERIVLEHHGDVAVFGLHVVDDAVADRNRPGGDVFEPRDHAQQGRLAAAGRVRPERRRRHPRSGSTRRARPQSRQTISARRQSAPTTFISSPITRTRAVNAAVVALFERGLTRLFWRCRWIKVEAVTVPANIAKAALTCKHPAPIRKSHTIIKRVRCGRNNEQAAYRRHQAQTSIQRVV